MKLQLALRSLCVAREPLRLSLEGGTVSYDGVIERVGADFFGAPSSQWGTVSSHLRAGFLFARAP